MSYDDNIAYDAEKFGLKFLGELSLSDEPYQFDYAGLWKGEEGYYLSTDSGCSCPSPWENHCSMDDLTGPLTAEQAKEELTSLWEGSYYTQSLKRSELEDFLKFE